MPLHISPTLPREECSRKPPLMRSSNQQTLQQVPVGREPGCQPLSTTSRRSQEPTSSSRASQGATRQCPKYDETFPTEKSMRIRYRLQHGVLPVPAPGRRPPSTSKHAGLSLMRPTVLQAVSFAQPHRQKCMHQVRRRQHGQNTRHPGQRRRAVLGQANAEHSPSLPY